MTCHKNAYVESVVSSGITSMFYVPYKVATVYIKDKILTSNNNNHYKKFFYMLRAKDWYILKELAGE